LRAIVIRTIRIIRVERFPRQKSSNAAWSRSRGWTQGRLIRRSSTSIVDTIRFRRRSRLPSLWHPRSFHSSWLRRRNWRFLFNGRFGRRWDVGTVREGEGYWSELWEFETPIGLAVGRHSGVLVDPSSELIAMPPDKFRNRGGRKYSVSKYCIILASK